MPKSCSFRASMATRIRLDYLPATPLQPVAAPDVANHSRVDAVVPRGLRRLHHAGSHLVGALPHGLKPLAAVPLRRSVHADAVGLKRRKPGAIATPGRVRYAAVGIAGPVGVQTVCRPAGLLDRLRVLRLAAVTRAVHVRPAARHLLLESSQRRLAPGARL